MILNDGPTLVIAVPGNMLDLAPQSYALKSIERMHLLTVLEKTGWRVRGKNGAAALLELPPSTLESKMKKLGIKRKAIKHEI